jgi:hypothetical protein
MLPRKSTKTALFAAKTFDDCAILVALQMNARLCCGAAQDAQFLRNLMICVQISISIDDRPPAS